MSPLRSQREPIQEYLPYVMKAIGLAGLTRAAERLTDQYSRLQGDRLRFSGSIGTQESGIQSSSSDASLPDCAQSSLETS